MLQREIDPAQLADIDKFETHARPATSPASSTRTSSASSA